MKINSSTFWYGSEESLRDCVSAQEQMKGTIPEEEYLPQSRLTSVQGGVAVINIQGPLTHQDSEFNQYFGITSYNEIRSAVVEALEDDGVDRILFDMDTQGGSAKGIDQLGDFIVKASKIKPIETFLSGSAFSAGYWIASATDKIYGSKMSEAGSVGVISMMMNQAKAMKDDGYEVTVFRGGKFKALGNPYEAMSDTAKKVYQDKVDIMYSFFLDAVSENRGISRSSVQKISGEGLTFFAEESVRRNLMDEVISFDDLYGRMVRQSNSSGDRVTLNEGIDDMAKKKVFTEKSVAALSAGADSEKLEDLLDEAPSAKEETPEVKAEADAPPMNGSNKAEAQETSADAETPEVKVEADDGTDTSATDVEPQAQASDSLVGYLKQELSEANAKVMNLTTDLEKATASAEEATSNESALKKIAAQFVANMSVGLGMTAMDLSNMDTSVVLTQYADVSAKFSDQFKVGSLANVEDDEPEASSGAAPSPIELASIRANKL